MNMVKGVEERVHQNTEKLDHIQRLIEQVAMRQRAPRERANGSRFSKHLIDTLIVIFVVFVAQYIMRFWGGGPSLKAKEL